MTTRNRDALARQGARSHAIDGPPYVILIGIDITDIMYIMTSIPVKFKHSSSAIFRGKSLRI